MRWMGGVLDPRGSELELEEKAAQPLAGSQLPSLRSVRLARIWEDTQGRDAGREALSGARGGADPTSREAAGSQRTGEAPVRAGGGHAAQAPCGAVCNTPFGPTFVRGK